MSAAKSKYNSLVRQIQVSIEKLKQIDFFKRITCKHDYEFVGIITLSIAEYQCKKCPKKIRASIHDKVSNQ